jgi:hypothetical protein
MIIILKVGLMALTGERFSRFRLLAIAVASVLMAGGAQAIENASSDTTNAIANAEYPADTDSNPAQPPQGRSLDASNALFAAAKAADSGISLGPVSACFDQVRAFACPIVGNIPVIGEIVGMISLELGISCPTGNSNPNRS